MAATRPFPAAPSAGTTSPLSSVRQWSTQPERDYLDATCAYAGFTHRRRIVFMKPATVIVLDTVDGPSGDHTLEQFWHLDSAEDAARFSFSTPPEVVDCLAVARFVQQGTPPQLFASRCAVRCLRTWRRCSISRSPRRAAPWRFGPMETRSWWVSRRGTRPDARSGFRQAGSTASSDTMPAATRC